MNKFFFLIIFTLSFVLVGCSEAQTEKNAGTKKGSDQKKDAPQTKTKQPEEDTKKQPLTTETAEEFLLDYVKNDNRSQVRISTDFGDIDIELFMETPVHRANFLYLTDIGYFDETEFYRVGAGFVCQAGNSDDFELQQLRADIGKYTLIPEPRDSLFNRYGSVAMARQYKRNPEKRSSCYEFFINVGKPQSPAELKQVEEKYGVSLDENMKRVYSTEGGNPHLDNDHTVFGKVIRGMDVVEKINKVETDSREWPKEAVNITVKPLK